MRREVEKKKFKKELMTSEGREQNVRESEGNK